MSSMMFKLSIGKGEEFLNQSITLGSIVALIAGGLSVTNLSTSFLNVGTNSNYAPLVNSLSSELTGLLFAWVLPVTFLLIFSSFILGLRSGQLTSRTHTILRYAGSPAGRVRQLMTIRLLLLSLTSWLFGWVGGLIVSQLAFRFVAIATASPYLIPFLSPLDILVLALMTFGSIFAGNSVLFLKTGSIIKEEEVVSL
ncbi:MAG: hypothetical protein JRN68_09615 [Nitrososphaerota archaeon]|nr:hypothetical protein [Nitrososphaerota archaeon]